MFETLSRHPNIAPLLQRYASMTAMEQVVVKLCALILAGLLLYTLAWSPAKEFMDKSRNDLERAEQLLTLVEKNKATLIRLAKGSTSSKSLTSQQLVSSVTNLAKRQGLNLKRFEPSGTNEVKVWVEQVPFDDVVTWLAALSKSLKIEVNQLSLERGDAEGLVSARLSLSS
jgi:general secretion pathway protein M